MGLSLVRMFSGLIQYHRCSGKGAMSGCKRKRISHETFDSIGNLFDACERGDGGELEIQDAAFGTGGFGEDL